jgi:hypothetical protein
MHDISQLISNIFRNSMDKLNFFNDLSLAIIR